MRGSSLKAPRHRVLAIVSFAKRQQVCLTHTRNDTRSCFETQQHQQQQHDIDSRASTYTRMERFRSYESANSHAFVMTKALRLGRTCLLATRVQLVLACYSYWTTIVPFTANERCERAHMCTGHPRRSEHCRQPNLIVKKPRTREAPTTSKQLVWRASTTLQMLRGPHALAQPPVIFDVEEFPLLATTVTLDFIQTSVKSR